MGEDRVRSLRVCCTQLAATAPHSAYDYRDRELSSEHVAQLRGLIDDMLHRRECEVNRHQFRDGTLPNHRRTDCRTDDGGFCNWSIFHALGSVFVIKAFCHGICTAPNPHFFTENKDGWITIH